MIALATVGSEKATEPQVVDLLPYQQPVKRTNFEQVAGAACPHCNAALLPLVGTKDVGLKLDCSKCGHTGISIRRYELLAVSLVKEPNGGRWDT